MTGQAQAVRNGFQVGGQLPEDLVGVALEPAAAEIEHRPILRVDNLDPQPFGRDVEQQLILVRRERLALGDGFLQVAQQRIELLPVSLVCDPTRGFNLRFVRILRRPDGRNGCADARRR